MAAAASATSSVISLTSFNQLNQHQLLASKKCLAASVNSHGRLLPRLSVKHHNAAIIVRCCNSAVDLLESPETPSPSKFLHLHSPNSKSHSISTETAPLLESLESTYRKSPNGLLAQRWREYHGSNNWQGLIEPLDAELRTEILKYGDMAQLTYDAFDAKTGNCVHDKDELLLKASAAGLEKKGYTVTKYIYATPDVRHVLPTWLRKIAPHIGSSGRHASKIWIGYVAVATDEEEIRRLGRRDVVVAWRGTVTPVEWIEDIDGVLVDPLTYSDETNGTFKDVQSCPAVERGFWSVYAGGDNSAANQLREEMRRLMSVYGARGHQMSVTMTGHSLGGALAMLAAYDVKHTGAVNSDVPVSVISFAAPRVGNRTFARWLDHLGVHALRVVNAHDFVPKVPKGDGFLNNLGTLIDDLHHISVDFDLVLDEDHDAAPYTHHGVAFRLNNHHSPYLKRQIGLVDAHNLEVYLHLVDGYRSSQEPFVGNIGRSSPRTLKRQLGLLSRDVSLLNKSSSLLLDELHVNPCA